MDHFNFLGLLLIIVICVCVFLLCRELFAWYNKINKRISNQERIIKNQEKIYDLLLKMNPEIAAEIKDAEKKEKQINEITNSLIGRK